MVSGFHRDNIIGLWEMVSGKNIRHSAHRHGAVRSLTPYSPEAVRGNALNDIFICGAYGEMLHYNGVSWKSYISQTGIDGAYLGLSVSGNTVIAVGYLSSSQAIILMGKR